MKTLMFIISLAIGGQTQVFAQEDSVIKEERIYKKVNGYELKTDMFYSAGTQEKDNNPAIAFFHGGGWVFGDPSEFHEACKRYALKGFVTFSFQYRLSINEDGSYPHPDITPVESVKDARTAIRWLRENAESLRIDPEKIVVGGQSAGGQLVWATALFDTVNENTDNLSISTV
ncbi:MAG: alpha/beta hydrolase, partial [Cyclobacteriaceae bacterium]|nr:alpha/beta hydrolase [Cyclobacteriaceae bacterium]